MRRPAHRAGARLLSLACFAVWPSHPPLSDRRADRLTFCDAARAVRSFVCLDAALHANPTNAIAILIRTHNNHGDPVDPAGHQVRARGAGDSAVAWRGGGGSLASSADLAFIASSGSCVGCHRVLHLPKSAWSWTCICGCENDYFNMACVNLQCRKPRPAEFRVRDLTPR